MRDADDKTGFESTAEQCSEAVKRAKVELDKARMIYEQLNREAAEQLKSVRQMTVGDAIAGALETVRRHPGAGLTVAALAGFFLGKLFRR